MSTLILAAAAALFVILGGWASAEPLKITVNKPNLVLDRDLWYKAQVRCLRETVYTEARGENEEGQLLVAYVVAQRALENRRDWGGGTICDVAYAIRIKKNGKVTSQFSGPIHHPVKVPEGDQNLVKAEEVAMRVLRRQWKPKENFACARYYFSEKDADPTRAEWFKNLQRAGKVGNHTFFCEQPKLARRS